MRDLVRQIIANYGSTKLEGQDEGVIRFSGLESDTRLPVLIQVVPRLLGREPGIADQFRKLAQLIRQLNHPNIAAVRDVGEKAGLPYFVTRAVEKAHPLAAKIGQPWAIDAAADAVMQVGQALEHAYQKGLVHGSLSPQNVLVEENGRVQVSDFGLSQLRELMGVQLRQIASPYTAPERTVDKRADPAADVYSLGALLYSMLAGRPPQVVQGQILPPGRFNPDVPPAMDQVVTKALARDPADRYRDIRSFLVALGAVRLLPAALQPRAETAADRCPSCGTTNQSGRFCRKCGAPLAEPARTEAAQPPASGAPGATPSRRAAARGRVAREAEEGIATHSTAVLTGEGMALFPEPLPMPEVHLEDLWETLGREAEIAMPEPLPMPVIDWAEAAPDMPEIPTIDTRS